MKIHNQQGFTLIEVMVTLTLLATLAVAAIPMVQRHHQQQNEYLLRESLRQIRGALDQFSQVVQEGRIESSTEGSYYPTYLEQLVEGVVDKTSPNKTKIYFLRSIPRDPFCNCDSLSDAETWRMRSSTQPPDDFTGGKDIFDIRSRSHATGLNGVPYEKW